jgi:hypothetical protein
VSTQEYPRACRTDASIGRKRIRPARNGTWRAMQRTTGPPATRRATLRVLQGAPGYAWVLQGTLGYSRVRLGTLGYAWIL